ncbi:MAG: hypothetical protein JF632_08760 [Acidobacteria bacterium]|nr:hypothetical protein [Acidobacteriota bacterium]
MHRPARPLAAADVSGDVVCEVVGNNYADEWTKEAAKRGLLNHRTSVDAYGELMKPDVVETFEKYKVLNLKFMAFRRPRSSPIDRSLR